jgi:hypothetical protein
LQNESEIQISVRTINITRLIVYISCLNLNFELVFERILTIIKLPSRIKWSIYSLAVTRPLYIDGRRINWLFMITPFIYSIEKQILKKSLFTSLILQLQYISIKHVLINTIMRITNFYTRNILLAFSVCVYLF